MKRGTWRLGVVLAILLGVGSGVSLAAEAVATFQYAPGLKPRVESTKTTQTLQPQGVAPQTRINTYREQQVATPTEQGYLVKDILLEGTTLGQEEVDPVMAALKGKPITMTVDRAGKIVSMQGWEAVSQELLKLLPPGAPEAIRKIVTPEFLGATVRREWANSVTDYARPSGPGRGGLG